MVTRALTVIFASALLLIVYSCNSSGCTEGRSGIPLVEFRSSATGEQIWVDSLQIYGIGAPGDSSIVKASTTQSTVYMPLEADKSVTRWCIAYKRENLDYVSLIDTLTFRYSAYPYFVSEDCGVGYRFDISSLTTTYHLIDSVQLIDPLITNVDKTYVAIYFRTE